MRHGDLDAFLTYNAAQGFGAAQALATSRALPDETIKVVGLRRRIAENMAASKRHIPHFTYVEECDVTELEKPCAPSSTKAHPERPKLTRAAVADHRDLPRAAALPDDQRALRRRGEYHHPPRRGAPRAGHDDRCRADGARHPRCAGEEPVATWRERSSRLPNAARERARRRRKSLSGSTITLSSLGPLGGICLDAGDQPPGSGDQSRPTASSSGRPSCPTGWAASGSRSASS